MRRRALLHQSFGDGLAAAVLLLSLVLSSGCAALTNPALHGVPVRKLPRDLIAGSREACRTIPLTLLAPAPPPVYQIAANDVLGIYIDGILPAVGTEQTYNPPVYFPSQINPIGRGLPPTLGFPIQVRENGTIALPLIEPVAVDSLSITAVEDAIRQAYVRKGIFTPGGGKIVVTLMQPRQIRVLVLRQESGGFATTSNGNAVTLGGKRGSGHVVYLRAYENNVLSALTETGGLPGLDNYDEVVIFRNAQNQAHLIEQLSDLKPGTSARGLASPQQVTVIPLRSPAGHPMPFTPEDAVLHNGDVVFVNARVTELFYTGGLLPSGEFALPRDYDLDVVEAVTQVKGALVNGAFGGSNLAGDLLKRGIGNPSPSQLSVVRRTPGGGQVVIRVDLDRAMHDARERINVQPGDLLILQETPSQALARWLSQTFSFAAITRVIDQTSTQGTVSAAGP